MINTTALGQIGYSKVAVKPIRIVTTSSRWGCYFLKIPLVIPHSIQIVPYLYYISMKSFKTIFVRRVGRQTSIYDELLVENNDALGEMDFGADIIGKLMHIHGVFHSVEVIRG